MSNLRILIIIYYLNRLVPFIQLSHFISDLRMLIIIHRRTKSRKRQAEEESADTSVSKKSCVNTSPKAVQHTGMYTMSMHSLLLKRTTILSHLFHPPPPTLHLQIVGHGWNYVQKLEGSSLVNETLIDPTSQIGCVLLIHGWFLLAVVQYLQDFMSSLLQVYLDVLPFTVLNEGCCGCLIMTTYTSTGSSILVHFVALVSHCVVRRQWEGKLLGQIMSSI